MKKLYYVFIFSALIMGAVAGCGSSSDGAATEKTEDVEGTVTEDERKKQVKPD